MAEVKIATRAHIPQLVLLGEEFALMSQPVHGFSVSRERILLFANEVVGNPECVVLSLCEGDQVVGLIVGVLNKIFFSEDIALQELVWYVKKEHKGFILLDAFEKIAPAVGATHVIVGNKPAFLDLTRLYQRREYTLLENQFIKKLG